MIKLYPVLVSNSVSKNIIPGILKSVERFALIYKLDDLARSARKDAGISLRKVGKRLVMKESDEEIAAFLANEILHEQSWQQRHQTGSKGKGTSSTAGAFGHVSSSVDADQEEEIQKGRGKMTGSRFNEPPPNLNPRQKDLWYRWNREVDDSRQNVARGHAGIAGSRFEKPPKGLNARQKDLWYRWKSEIDEERMATAKERGKAVGRMQGTPADVTISIGQMDMKSIMLEPTWMKIDRVTKYGQKFTSVLGVKAVAVPVKSDASLAQLLTFDKQVGRLMHLTLKAGRWVTGKLYRLYSKTIQRMIDPDPEAISGDPYKDIVLKRTIIKEMNVKDVFLVLNQADLSEDFAVDAKGIRKLMSLGWQSFCIADDVNRRLTFCMSEFKGMCNTLPYTMIYQSLEQAKVFEDLEDIRRSSTSLFRTRIPMKKVIGESIAQKKLQEYGADLFYTPPEQTQELLNEISYIDENFASVMKKALQSPKQFLLRVFKGNVKVPQLSIDRVLKIGKKVDPQFIKAHTLAKRVLSNSIKTEELDENYINWAAISVVLRAKTLPGKDLISKTRDVLMSIIPLFRKGIRKAKESTMNIPPQHRVEAVFGLIGIFVLVSVIGFLYTWTLIVSFKIKPYVGEVFKTLSEFMTWSYTKLKSLISTDYEGPGEIVNFWTKLSKDIKPDFGKLFAGYKKQFESFLETKTGEGGVVDNLKDKLKDDYDLHFSEIGALIVIAVIGLYAFRYAVGRKK